MHNDPPRSVRDHARHQTCNEHSHRPLPPFNPGGKWAFDLYYIGESESEYIAPSSASVPDEIDEVVSEQQIVLDLHNEAR